MSGGHDPAADLAQLYREAVKRHAAEPVGYQAPIKATHRHEMYNALCGDRVEIRLRVTGEQVEAAAFEGEACAICRASASMLCSLVPARPLAWLRSLSGLLQEALRGSNGNREQGAGHEAGVVSPKAEKCPPSAVAPSLLRDRDTGDTADASINGDPAEEAEIALPDELKPLLGVRRYPSRRRCATLPWEAALRALDDSSAQPADNDQTR